MTVPEVSILPLHYGPPHTTNTTATATTISLFCNNNNNSNTDDNTDTKNGNTAMSAYDDHKPSSSSRSSSPVRSISSSSCSSNRRYHMYFDMESHGDTTDRSSWSRSRSNSSNNSNNNNNSNSGDDIDHLPGQDDDDETLRSVLMAMMSHFGRHMLKLSQVRSGSSSSRYLFSQTMMLVLGACVFYMGAYINSLCQVIVQTMTDERFTDEEVLPDIGFYLFPQIDWLSTELAVGLPLALMYGRIGIMFIRGLIRKWSRRNIVDQQNSSFDGFSSSSSSRLSGNDDRNCGDSDGTTLMIAIPMIIVKRIWLIHGAIFLLRGLAITITILPNPHALCVATIDKNASMFWNAFLITAGQVYTCNDVFFSGHAAGITLSMLFWLTYAPERKFTYLVILPLSLGGWFTLIATRFHYTLDVFFGILLAFFAWMVYHVALHIHFNHTISAALSKSSRSPWRLWRILAVLDVVEGRHSSHRAIMTRTTITSSIQEGRNEDHVLLSIPSYLLGYGEQQRDFRREIPSSEETPLPLE